MSKAFPFVSTTELLPGGKLYQHRHHSRNKHLIISGSIKIGRSRDDLYLVRPSTPCSDSYVELPGIVDYKDEAGPQGCIFVEGHTVLSPTTAQRFMDRGTIVKVSKGTEGAFTTEEH